MLRQSARCVLVGVLVCAGWGCARGEQISVTLRNAVGLQTAATDQHGQPFTVSEMSGVTYLGGNTFAAVSDDGGKVVTFEVTFDAIGNLQTAAVSGGLSLANVADFEGIAYTDAAAGTAWMAEEDTPGVHLYRLSDGAKLETLATPAVFGQRRTNLGFESLARMPGTGDLWTGNEGALVVDGPTATETAGTTVRLLRYNEDGGNFTATEQYAYEVDPLHGQAISGARSGLVELVATPVPTNAGGLLAVERSLAFSQTEGLFRTAIYEVDVAGATEVSGLAGLDGAAYTPAAKTELFAGAVVPGGMNLEGLAVGPVLAPGHWAMVGVVDDGDPVSTNSLVAFELMILPDGDVNGDAVVDGLDANIVSFFFLKSPATREEGDLNGDGVVNGLDANIVSEHFGESTAVGAETEVVPEPGAMGLLLFSTWLARVGGRR